MPIMTLKSGVAQVYGPLLVGQTLTEKWRANFTNAVICLAKPLIVRMEYPNALYPQPDSVKYGIRFGRLDGLMLPIGASSAMAELLLTSNTGEAVRIPDAWRLLLGYAEFNDTDGPPAFIGVIFFADSLEVLSR